MKKRIASLAIHMFISAIALFISVGANAHPGELGHVHNAEVSDWLLFLAGVVSVVGGFYCIPKLKALFSEH